MPDLYLNINKKIKKKQDMQHDGRRVIHAGFILRVLTHLYSDERGGLTTNGVSWSGSLCMEARQWTGEK